MEQREWREPITVELISKEQFCRIMDAIHEQDLLAESICDSLSQIADIFAFDVNNRYRRELENLLTYLFDDIGDWIGYWMYEGNWKQFSWWDEQNTEHIVSSHEELYDFLIDKVAIYVRVSTDDPRQTTSYELQKKYYEEFVNHHPNWTLVHIYADEGISGTSRFRRRILPRCPIRTEASIRSWQAT